MGTGALERGDCAFGSSRDHANQCSASAGVGAEGTNGVSALARVVSGCETQERTQASGTGGDLVFCPFVVLDRASVGEGEPTHGSGARCHQRFRERWTILSISVVIRSCAIPVAWKVLGGHEKGSWRPHWEGLLKHLQGSIPADWQVLVMADRGLYARWLFQAICACGWHPFLRINLGVKARAEEEENFDWIGRWTPMPGTRWKGKVECFAGKASRLKCSLLMHWEAGYEHPWAVLTDLDPEQAEVSWYGMRTWIETGYKDFKRGLWGWHHSKMREAGRVERFWLAMAVAQLWAVSVGCQAEQQQQRQERAADLPATHLARRRRTRPADQPPPRRLSCVVRGRLGLVAALFNALVLPCGRLVPEPWPETITPPKKGSKPSQQRQREKRRKRKKRQKAAQRRKVAA